MTLIASISGIRGTIGGDAGNNLTPIDIVNFASAYGTWLSARRESRTVVLGRDARISGPMVEQLVVATLNGLGFDVINLGLATTPTVEMAVPAFEAAGGIILTASHNPAGYNALKLLNHKGEFVSKKDGLAIIEILENGFFVFAGENELGKETLINNFLKTHISDILKLPLVDKYAIENAGFKVVVDAVNSVGGIAIPELLKALGVKNIVKLNCEPTGIFAHNPEPLKENLSQICDYIAQNGADLGVVVDPDADRLVLVDEKGQLFGEEYTLVAIADYVLPYKLGAVVSNLSSSRALRDIAERHGCPYRSSAVGEVNVIEIMKRSDAVIGGEGNGGVIYPDLHYGRDALVGVALFLSHLVKSGKKCSALRATYPDYFMSKQKIDLDTGINVDEILEKIYKDFESEEITDIDGVKIDFQNSWIHLRKSNTEPIIRIYSEAPSQAEADNLANRFVALITDLT